MTQTTDDKGTLTLNVNDTLPFFATPCYGGFLTESYHRSMLNLQRACAQAGLRHMNSTLTNESLVTRARNTLTATFLSFPDATHLFFIDADIGFQPDDVLRMVARDKDIIAGVYPKKSVAWPRVLEAVKRGGGVKEMEEAAADFVVNFKANPSDDAPGRNVIEVNDGLIEVLDAGTGFMCIKRSVIERMIREYPELRYVNDLPMAGIDTSADIFYSLFDTIHCPDTNRYLSEDYAFCRRWQKIGGRVFIDPFVTLTHTGSHVHVGRLMNVLRSETTTPLPESYRNRT